MRGMAQPDSILRFRVQLYRQLLLDFRANCVTQTNSTGCNFSQNTWSYCTHNLQPGGKFEWLQKDNHPPEYQVLGFSFSTAQLPTLSSPLIPLDLLYAVLPKILPSYPTPQSCQQLPTFLLAQHLAHPHLTISYTHPQPVISSSLFHIKP